MTGYTRTDHAASGFTARQPGSRWLALDMARGAAVLAMFVYHFAWDLRFFNLIEVDVVGDPAWRWFARAIAGSFLLLVGVSLVLAHGGPGGVRHRAFAKRFAIIATAALLVTAGTAYAMPEGTIWFGILHCIAISSLLALPFLRVPMAVVGAAALVSLAAPTLLSADLFNAAPFYPLGLRTLEPRTNDYVPLFPWFGCVLLGVMLARLWLAQAKSSGQGAEPGKAGRLLSLLGRYSLPIYLLHQPVFIGVLWAATSLFPAQPSSAEAREFRDGCRAQCALAGSSRAVCDTYCGCAEQELVTAGLWQDAITNRLGASTDDIVARIVGVCRRKAGIAGPEAQPE